MYSDGEYGVKALATKPRLHLLLVEDSEDDAALVLRHLLRAGYNVIHERVETETHLRSTLCATRWDIVLSDYVLPSMNGLRVVRLIRETNEYMPIILLSGKIGEETAVAAMRAGAQDYLMKDNLARLVPAVERELVEARLHQSHRAASTALRHSQELFHRIVETTNEGILTTDPSGSILFVNQRLATMLGCSRETLLGAPLDEAIERQLLPSFPAALNGLRALAQQELAFQTTSGQSLWFSASCAPLYEPDGRFLGTLLLFSDITARKAFEDRIRHETLHDSLTGLANLTLVRDRVGHAIRRQSRHQASHAALLLLDLDRFRAINDSLGHAAGDRVLLEVACRLQQCTRIGDTVARLNADEFSVLLEDISGTEEALRVAASLHTRLTQPLLVEGQDLVASASIGLVPLSGQYETAEDVLRDADVAMDRAKSMGRGAVVVFHPTMRAGVVDRLQLENDLRKALAQNELRVHYQPILDLQTAGIVGVEALVRWQHPVRGLLLPREFLALAGELGIAGELDWWVLQHACHQIARWREMANGEGLLLYVNCSGERFGAPGAVQKVAAIAHDARLPLSAVRLEIVEGEIASEPAAVLDGLAELKRRGAGIIVDDFGTGHSSLDRISRLPITGLKIAGSFFTPGAEHFRIVSTILHLAQDLNLTVVAEGVETTAQADWLRRMRCDYAQGFCFAPPLVPEVAELFIAKGRIIR